MMNKKKIICEHIALLSFFLVFFVVNDAFSGNKRIMTVRAAKVLAERALVETIFGLKLRAVEKVEDLVATSFKGTTESKTKALVNGISFEEVVYDPKQDIAKVTAVVQVGKIVTIDGIEIDLGNKTFRRVAFATSTPTNAGPLKALRAAELDAYKQLMKRIVGFELESHTTVENYLLKSELVKTKVLATLCLAEVTEYGWTDEGDAYVKMQINVSDIEGVLGEKLLGSERVIEVIGEGAQEDNFTPAREKHSMLFNELGSGQNFSIEGIWT